jgi:hypothetical protein
MALTGISQVRQHLNRVNLGEGDIRDQQLYVVSEEYTYLPHAHIVSASETVKAVESDVPVMETITLNESPVSLDKSHIVTGSIVCAADSSLSKMFQENVDFSVDYCGGTLARIDSGAIAAGSNVSVWYIYYRIYQKGTDYQIDYERGRIRRLSGGAIEDGQAILIDYRLGGTQFSDDEIEQAIVEAEAEIAILIHTDYRESTDPALQTAATSLVLSILCRNAAGMAFSGSGYSDKTAAGWMELAGSYRRTAMRLVGWFGKPAPALRPPRIG